MLNRDLIGFIGIFGIVLMLSSCSFSHVGTPTSNNASGGDQTGGNDQCVNANSSQVCDVLEGLIAEDCLIKKPADYANVTDAHHEFCVTGEVQCLAPIVGSPSDPAPIAPGETRSETIPFNNPNTDPACDQVAFLVYGISPSQQISSLRVYNRTAVEPIAPSSQGGVAVNITNNGSEPIRLIVVANFGSSTCAPKVVPSCFTIGSDAFSPYESQRADLEELFSVSLCPLPEAGPRR